MNTNSKYTSFCIQMKTIEYINALISEYVNVSLT